MISKSVSSVGLIFAPIDKIYPVVTSNKSRTLSLYLYSFLLRLNGDQSMRYGD